MILADATRSLTNLASICALLAPSNLNVTLNSLVSLASIPPEPFTRAEHAFPGLPDHSHLLRAHRTTCRLCARFVVVARPPLRCIHLRHDRRAPRPMQRELCAPDACTVYVRASVCGHGPGLGPGCEASRRSRQRFAGGRIIAGRWYSTRGLSSQAIL